MGTICDILLKHDSCSTTELKRQVRSFWRKNLLKEKKKKKNQTIKEELEKLSTLIREAAVLLIWLQQFITG